MARVLPTVDQIDRGLVLCIAGARAHLAGKVGRAGVAGGDGNHDGGGGRNSGKWQNSATVHYRGRQVVLRPPGGAGSTTSSRIRAERQGRAMADVHGGRWRSVKGGHG